MNFYWKSYLFTYFSLFSFFSLFFLSFFSLFVLFFSSMAFLWFYCSLPKLLRVAWLLSIKKRLVILSIVVVVKQKSNLLGMLLGARWNEDLPAIHHHRLLLHPRKYGRRHTHVESTDEPNELLWREWLSRLRSLTRMGQ